LMLRDESCGLIEPVCDAVAAGAMLLDLALRRAESLEVSIDNLGAVFAGVAVPDRCGKSVGSWRE